MSERVAEWTPTPVEATKAVLLRNLERKRWRRAWALGTLSAVGLLLLVLFGVLWASVDVAWPILAFFAVLGSGAAAVTMGIDAQRLRLARRSELQHEFSGIQGWLVQVTIYQGATPTGSDCGLVWLENARLMFVGQRTSFGISTRAIDEKRVISEPSRTWQQPYALGLRKRTAAGKVKLRLDFIPFENDSPLSSQTEGAFHQSLQRWLRTDEDGEDQLPPLTLGPDAPSRPALAQSVLAAALAWPSLGSLVLFLWITTGWISAVFAAAIAFVALTGSERIGSPRRAWDAWRDRRRLDAAQ